MRCQCCNRSLNDFESTRKDLENNYLDTCNKCIKGLGIKTIDRADLEPNEEAPEDDPFSDGFLDDVDFEDEDG